MKNLSFINDNGVTQIQNIDQNLNISSSIDNNNSSQINFQMIIFNKTSDNNESIIHENGQIWGRDIEFLMSCISMSIGLGNVWRFPFTALDNGGGAFLLPYVIVLLLIGRPIYYLEMIVGQFSGKNSIQIYDVSPIFRGVGYAQIFLMIFVSTYYTSVMAIIGRYLWDSFHLKLPWGICKINWKNCIDADDNIVNGESYDMLIDVGKNVSHQFVSSSKYYFE